jgi:hypothetical protein
VEGGPWWRERGGDRGERELMGREVLEVEEDLTCGSRTSVE